MKPLWLWAYLVIWQASLSASWGETHEGAWLELQAPLLEPWGLDFLSVEMSGVSAFSFFGHTEAGGIFVPQQEMEPVPPASGNTEF